MDWARLLAYITGMVDQGLLLRNEYLAAENRILKPKSRPDCNLPTLRGLHSLRSVIGFAAELLRRWRRPNRRRFWAGSEG